MKKLFAITAVILTLQACKEPATNDSKTEGTFANKIDSLDWLAGTWEMTASKGTITESWAKANDSTLVCDTRLTTPDGKIVFSEDITLVQREGLLFYIPVISDQNDGRPIEFKETSFSAEEMVFENPEHDYPQRIVYRKTSDSTILAYIEGEENGEMKKREFPYIRRHN